MSKIKEGDILMVTVSGTDFGLGGNYHQFPVDEIVVVTSTDYSDRLATYQCEDSYSRTWWLNDHNMVKIGSL